MLEVVLELHSFGLRVDCSLPNLDFPFVSADDLHRHNRIFSTTRRFLLPSSDHPLHKFTDISSSCAYPSHSLDGCGPSFENQRKFGVNFTK